MYTLGFCLQRDRVSDSLSLRNQIVAIKNQNLAAGNQKVGIDISNKLLGISNRLLDLTLQAVDESSVGRVVTFGSLVYLPGSFVAVSLNPMPVQFCGSDVTDISHYSG